MAVEVERFIRIQAPYRRASGEIDWRTVPNCTRVRVWHMATAEALPDEVETDATSKRLIFHIAYTDGVERGCRVGYLGESFAVLGVSDSTRLRGLELRCAPQGQPDGRAGA